MFVQVIHKTLEVIVADRVGKGCDVLLLHEIISVRLDIPDGLHGKDDAGQVPRLRINGQRIAVHRLFLDLVDVILESGGESQDQGDADDTDGSRKGGQKSPSLLGQKVVQAKAKGCGQVHRGLSQVLVDGRLLALDRERIGVGYDLAVLETDDAVRVFLSQLRVMGDHDDQAVIGHFLEQIHDLNGGLGVQSAGGLVREEYLGVIDQGAGDGDTLHLSAGHLVGLFVGLLLEADLVEGVKSHLSALVSRNTADGQSQLDVLQDSLVGDQVVGLENKADGMIAVGVPVAVLVFFGRDAVDDQISGVVAVQSSDNVQESGLSRSARAQDRDEFVVPEV